MKVGKLALRIVIGGLFIGHGTQKLLGWFGGSGLEGTDKMMEALDMQPARRNSITSGVTEAGCGALLVVGLGTPFAVAGLIGSMITAVRKVHWKNGPWNSNGGWEYNTVIIAALTALADSGPGPVSLDAALGRERSGSRWALAALALGAAGSTAAIELGRRATRRATVRATGRATGRATAEQAAATPVA